MPISACHTGAITVSNIGWLVSFYDFIFILEISLRQASTVLEVAEYLEHSWKTLLNGLKIYYGFRVPAFIVTLGSTERRDIQDTGKTTSRKIQKYL